MKKKPKATTVETKLNDRVVELRRVRAGELQSHPLNYRRHPDAQLKALTGILGEVGIADAVLGFPADGLGPKGDFSRLMIFDGHARKDRDSDQIWPVLVTNLTMDEANKMLAVLDPLSGLATNDSDVLKQLVEKSQIQDASVKSMLDDLIKKSAIEADGDTVDVVQDEAPELPKVAVTKPGELWALGNHRLLCGDSLDAANVARLMGGVKAELTIGDPPYLLNTATGNKGCFAENYKKVTSEALQKISDSIDIPKLFESIESACRKFNAFIFCSNKQIPELMSTGLDRDISTTLLAWHKYNSVPFSEGTWRQDAEWCVHYRTGNATFQGDAELKRKIETLPLNPSKFGHPTEKPVALITKYMRIGSNQGDIVFDPFLGSGTTLITAEQTNRRCFGVEIDPGYCDVIRARFERFTGQKSVLIEF